MCGIWASIGNTSEIIDQKSLIRRGPDSSTVVAENDVQLVFHRLAINGLTKESNQPFKVGDTYIMCNGELYNYKQVAQVAIVKYCVTSLKSFGTHPKRFFKLLKVNLQLLRFVYHLMEPNQLLLEEIHMVLDPCIGHSNRIT